MVFLKFLMNFYLNFRQFLRNSVIISLFYRFLMDFVEINAYLSFFRRFSLFLLK